MTKDYWIINIKEQMKEVETYQESFEHTIEALAEILEQRDVTYQAFLDSGGDPVVETVSDRGARNFRKNPRLQTWMDLNTQALAFWKECGLTPAGLKKINEVMNKTDVKVSALEEALNKLSSG